MFYNCTAKDVVLVVLVGVVTDAYQTGQSVVLYKLVHKVFILLQINTKSLKIIIREIKSQKDMRLCQGLDGQITPAARANVNRHAHTNICYSARERKHLREQKQRNKVGRNTQGQHRVETSK